MHKLIQKHDGEKLVYIWQDNNLNHLSPPFDTLEEAENWFIKSKHYDDKNTESRRIRHHDVDRRHPNDRRKRISMMPDRRTSPYGRRWRDEINKFRK